MSSLGIDQYDASATDTHGMGVHHSVTDRRSQSSVHRRPVLLEDLASNS